ncbi:MAG: PAS domain-containing protein, partial [Bryobacterales bacterium]|nr:PAS domain-containing protein [Bryobacterales bacterium]
MAAALVVSESPAAALHGEIRHLQATVARLGHALGVLSEAIAWTDERGVIRWANPAFSRLVQRPAMALIGRQLESQLPLFEHGAHL